MKTQALSLIKAHHDKSGGKCGMNIPDLQNSLETDWVTLKPILSELYTEKLIRIRNGINGKLLFLR